MLGQIVVVGIVPVLSACCYKWESEEKDNSPEPTSVEVEMQGLREFVLQPLRSDPSPLMFVKNEMFEIDDEEEVITRGDLSD